MTKQWKIIYSVDGGENCIKYVEGNTLEEAVNKIETMLINDGCDIPEFEILDVTGC